MSMSMVLEAVTQVWRGSKVLLSAVVENNEGEVEELGQLNVASSAGMDCCKGWPYVQLPTLKVVHTWTSGVQYEESSPWPLAAAECTCTPSGTPPEYQQGEEPPGGVNMVQLQVRKHLLREKPKRRVLFRVVIYVELVALVLLDQRPEA
jgi:hypothetical protein